jgi:hypothetical protein
MLSRDKTAIPCDGKNIFAFDPIIYSNQPRWALKSPSATECSTFGVVFGSVESILYALNQHLNTIKVTRLDDSVSPV